MRWRPAMGDGRGDFGGKHRSFGDDDDGREQINIVNCQRQGGQRMQVGHRDIIAMLVCIKCMQRNGIVIVRRDGMGVIMVGQGMVMRFPARHAGQHQAEHHPCPQQHGVAAGQAASTLANSEIH